MRRPNHIARWASIGWLVLLVPSIVWAAPDEATDIVTAGETPSVAGETPSVTADTPSVAGEAETSPFELSGPASFQGLEVKEVTVKLEGPYRQKDLSRIPVVQVGEPLSLRAVGRSIELLYRLGAIDDVLAEAERVPGGVVVRFRVWPSMLVGEVRFRGNHLIAAHRLLEQLTLRSGSPYSWADARLQATNLERFYLNEGYFNTSVSFEAERTRKDRMNVTFVSQDRPQARIREICFDGNEVMSPRTLQKVILLEEGQGLRPVELEEKRKALQDFYREEGYLSARVRSSYELDASKEWARLLFQVEEGPKIRLEFWSTRLPEMGPFGGGFWYRVYHWVGLAEEGRKPRLVGWYRRRHWFKVLDLEAEQHFSTGFMEEAADRIRTSLVQEGFNGPKVTPERAISPDEKKLSFKFVIDPGRKVRIQTVTFKGYAFFDEQILRELFDEAMQRYAPAGVYTEDAIDQALPLMIDYYRSQGFLEAQISRRVDVNEAGGLLKAAVRLLILEGPRTLVQEVELTGNTVYSTDELRQLVTIVPGEPYDPAKIRLTIEKLKAHYASQGYVNAQVFPSRKALEATPTAVVVRFEVDEGAQVRFGETIVRGARRTKPQVIARELTMRPGDVYVPEEIERSRTRLHSTGLFQKTSIYPVAGERTRDMMVEVWERKARVVALSGGFLLNGYDPSFRSAEFDTSLELTHYNLWGLGHRVSGKVELSTSYLPDFFGKPTSEGILQYARDLGDGVVAYLNQAASRRIVLSYQTPYLLGIKLDSIAQLTLFEREQLPTYLVNRNSFAWGLSRDFGSRFNGAFQFQASVRRLDESETDTKVQLWDVDREQRIFLQGSSVFLYDRRDSKMAPENGYLLSLQGEVIQAFGCGATWEGLEPCVSEALQPEETFARLAGSGSFLVPVRPWLRGELRTAGGFLAPIRSEDGALPVERRFYLGGAGSVRGFLQDSLGPVRFREKDLPSQLVSGWTTVPTGGNLTFSYNVEAQFALEYLSSWFEDLELAFFQDAGNVFWVGRSRDTYEEALNADLGNPDLQLSLTSSCVALLKNDTIRFSAGTGLRWRTSIGLIRFDVGFPLRRQCDLERAWAAHLSIGVY